MTAEYSNPGGKLRMIEAAGETPASAAREPAKVHKQGLSKYGGGLVSDPLLMEVRLRPEQRKALKRGEYITLTPVQARARESLVGIDGQIAKINKGNNSFVGRSGKVNLSDVEILREAVRQDIPIGPQTTIPELAREVGEMMRGLLEMPGDGERNLQITQRRGRHGRNDLSTEIKGKGLTEMESIAAQGEKAVLAHLAGQTTLQIAGRRDALTAAVAERIVNVPVRLAQVNAIQRALNVIGSGALGAEAQSEKTETFPPQRRGLFSRGGGQQPVQVTKRRDEKHGLAPGTQVNLRMEPDVPTRIAPSMSAAGFAFAGGRGAMAAVESSGGHARAAASGEEGAVAMAASSVIGGVELGGSGGFSIAISGGQGFDFNL